MTNAKQDQNFVSTMIGALSTDGVTPTLVSANATTHLLDVLDGATGSDLSGDLAVQDENGNVGLLAVSDVDGVTPVPIYVNGSNQLLIKST